MERTKNIKKTRLFLAIVWAFLLIFVLPGSLPAGNIPLPHNFELKKVPLRVIPVADLALTSITFEAKGIGSTGVVTISVKNVGKATSSKRNLSVVLMQGKRAKAKRSWSLKPLKPNETIKIKWTIRPGVGKNTVKASVDDPHNKKNNTMEKSFLFSPRLPKAMSQLKPIKRIPSKPPKKEIPSKVKPKALSKVQEPVKRIKKRLTPKSAEVLSKGTLKKRTSPRISTYQASVAHFIRPLEGGSVYVGTPYLVKWVLPEEMTGPDTRLHLELISAEDPPLIPTLLLAYNMDSSIRSCPMDTRNLPLGEYRLKLEIMRPGEYTYILSGKFFIKGPLFKVTEAQIIPAHPLLTIGLPLTFRGKIKNTGADALKPFWTKVTILSTLGQVEERLFKIGPLHSGEEEDISFTFPLLAINFDPDPQIGFHYRAIFEADYTHVYPSSSQKEVQVISLNLIERPDFIAYVDKIGNKTWGERVKFHIYVKNIGRDKTALQEIPVELTIGSERHLLNCKWSKSDYLWKCTYSKRFFSSGTKHYVVKVDPRSEIPESDKSNNSFEGNFLVYRLGEPVPKSTPPRPARIILKEIYGIPPASYEIHDLGEWASKIQLAFSVQCVSPDGEIFPGGWVPWLVAKSPSGILAQIPIVKARCSELWPGETKSFDASCLVSTDRFLPSPQDDRSPLWVELSLEVRKFLMGERIETLFCRRYNMAPRQEGPAFIGHFVKTFETFPRSGEKSLTIISPTENKTWTAGRTYQVAWIGRARGPYSLSLLVPGHLQPIKFAENISTHSFDFPVRHELPEGVYQIFIQGKDGWGISEPFRICSAETKPKIKLKVKSISHQIPNGCGENPYRIKIEVVLENEGGYQAEPIPFRFTIKGQGITRETEIPIGPMLDVRTLSDEEIFALEKGGNYTIKVECPLISKEPLFQKRNYFIKSLPDLRIAYRQRWDRLVFIVKNIGDGPAGPTHLKLKYKPSMELPSSPLPLPGLDNWHKEGEFLVYKSIPVKALGPGKWIRIEGPMFPFWIQGVETFYVKVNPHEEVEELCLGNNTILGSLSQQIFSEGVTRDMIGVIKNVPDLFSAKENYVRVPFDFVLWNAHRSLPATPPMKVVLTVRQGSHVETHSFNVPPLLGEAMGKKDKFHIRKVLSFPAGGGDIHYELILLTGSEASAPIVLDGGVVKKQKALRTEVI